MSIFKITVLLVCLCAFILTGCAPGYAVPKGAPAASLAFDLRSDSEGTTSRYFNIFAYEASDCEQSPLGSSMGHVMFAGSREMVGPIDVAADRRLTFAVSYLESRLNQNRGCSFTATFTPRKAERYQVLFSATNQSLNCEMKISDQYGADVDFHSPAASCASSYAGSEENGQGGISESAVRPYIQTAPYSR